MNTTNHQFLITQLRQKSMHKTMETIAVFVGCFFALLILPQLLMQYVFADQQLLEQPAIFQYMPVIAFIAGAGYFLMTVVGNMKREMEARRLEKELFANSWSPVSTEADSVEALQAAMKDLEIAAQKPAKSRTAAATKSAAKTKTVKTKRTRRSK